MRLTWRQRLAEDASLRDLANWPGLSSYQCEQAKYRKQFLRNQQIVAQVLAGGKPSEVAKQAGVSPSRVTRLLRRCLGGEETTPPRLTAGLVPYNHLTTGQRHTPLSTVKAPRGGKCAFSHLLRVATGLKEALDTRIKHDVLGHAQGENLTPKTLHQAFIAHLVSINWRRDTYPFTEERRGYESLRLYYQKTRTALMLPKVSKVPTQPKAGPSQIFEEIHIDAQSVDDFSQAAIEENGRLKPLRLARVNLYLARDVASQCYLGYWIAFTKHPTQDDVLELLQQLVTRWQPMPLTAPGLTYPPGPCFPTALDEVVQRATLGIVKLDNAYVHLARTVRCFICNRLGATVNLGLPKRPKGRQVIEQAFNRVNSTTHRFKSTSGSHPQDPIKEPSKLSKFPPLISIKVLEEAISVFLAEENSRPLAQLGNRSPLDFLQQQLHSCYVPARPRLPEDALNAFTEERWVRVRKARAEQRTPYIHFEYLRYSGSGLNRADLIGQKILIRFDRRDIRTLRAFSSKGDDLGLLLAPKSWQHQAHSLQTRKKIFRLKRLTDINSRDPLGGYFAYLLKHSALPKVALELVRVNREYGNTVIELPRSTKNAEPKPTKHRSSWRKTNIPDWSSSMVTRRQR